VAVMLNEQMLVMAQHTIIAAFVTGGLLMLGISAWQI
jgi:cytochrome bd-type quinol oxidase subunit 1